MRVVKDIVLEPTLRCNLACRMCSRQFLADHASQMDPALAGEVVRETGARLGAEPVNFSLGGYGEPLLYPHLEEVLRLIKRVIPHATVTLTSNGHLLDRAMGGMLLAAGLDYLRVSLNATGPEEYRRLMGGDGYERVTENLRRFLRLKRAGGDRRLKLGIQVLDTRVNGERFPAFREAWRPLLGPRDFLAYRLMENHHGKLDAVGLSQGRAAAYPARREPCYALWRYLALDTRGEVYACCAAYTFREGPTPLRLGNARQTPFGEFIEGAAVRELRARHLNNDYARLPECRTCSKPLNFPHPWRLVGGSWVAAA